MKKKSIVTHITPVGGNIFLDLGFPQAEAEALLAESKESIRLKQLEQVNKTKKSYWQDDGPLTDAQLTHLKALAKATPPKGKLVTISKLFSR